MFISELLKRLSSLNAAEYQAFVEQQLAAVAGKLSTEEKASLASGIREVAEKAGLSESHSLIRSLLAKLGPVVLH